MELFDGAVIAERYRIVRKIGAGGMGSVYMAEDVALRNQRVALKLLSWELSRDENHLKRFDQEVYFARKLSHENIVRVFDSGTSSDGLRFIVMEYVEGKTLAEVIETGGALSVTASLLFLRGIALALHAAHSEGIIHRDLKPSNVLITNAGVVKLADFGIAKSLVEDQGLTQTGHTVGTSFYMAPEQFGRKDVDTRVDIYALGILSFELATGRKPFEADNQIAMMGKHLTERLPSMKDFKAVVPDWFEAMVRKCAAKSPDHRFQTAREIATLLTAKLKSEGIVANNGVIEQLQPAGSALSLSLAVQFWNFLTRYWSDLSSVRQNCVMAFLLAAVYFLLAMPAVGVVDKLNLWSLDTWFMVRGAITPPKDIVVVRIDEESYEQLGVSELMPWPRELHSKLLERLAKIDPRGIVIDFVFKDETELATDEQLANAMTLSRTFIAEGMRYRMELPSERASQAVVKRIPPNRRFLDAATGVFSIGIRQSGGVVRQFPFVGSDSFSYPPLAPVVFGPENFGPHQVPSPHDQINYYGPNGTIRSVSFAEALSLSEAKLKSFSDSWFLIGFHRTLPTQSVRPDTFQAPYPGKTAGVEIHATMLGNLLSGDWLKGIPSTAVSYGGAWLVFLFGLGLRLLSQRNILAATLFATILLPAIQFAWLFQGYFIPFAGVAVVVALGGLVEVILRSGRARQIANLLME